MKYNRRNLLSLASAAAVTSLVPSISSGKQLIKSRPAFSDYKSRVIAVLLQNQRIYNPSLIPQMRKLFQETTLWDFVSIQPTVSKEYATALNFGLSNIEYITKITSETVPINLSISSNLVDMEKFVLESFRKKSPISLIDGISQDAWNEKKIVKWISGDLACKCFANRLLNSFSGMSKNLIVSTDFLNALKNNSEFIQTNESHPEKISRVGTWFVEKPNEEIEGLKNDIQFTIYTDPSFKDNPFSSTQTMIFSDEYLNRGLVFMPCYLKDKDTLVCGISTPIPEYIGIIRHCFYTLEATIPFLPKNMICRSELKCN
jgi:hypothetical protein